MARLYRLDESGQLMKIEECPFTDEPYDMQSFVKKNSNILGDVFIFGEQEQGGGRLDLLGIDKDGRVLIIELKNECVGASILGQVLQYKLFWKGSPDRLANLWGQAEDKPQDVQIDTENVEPKIIIVAPEFDQSLPKIAAMENLDIDFIQISRYLHGDETFVVVNQIETQEPKGRPAIAARPPEYNWAWYAEQFADNQQIIIGGSLFKQIIELCQERAWSIKPKFNKWYIAFKHGFYNCFILEFRHRGKVAIGLKFPDDPHNLGLDTPEGTWDKKWYYWIVEVESDDYAISSIEWLFKEAYERVVG